MCLNRVVLLTVLLQLVFGSPLPTGVILHCSRKDEEINCIPCRDLSNSTREEREVAFPYCPDDCGYTIEAKDCREPCPENCLHGRCKYMDGRIGLTCTGCKPNYAGHMCELYCLQSCFKCHQFNLSCIEYNNLTVYVSTVSTEATVTSDDLPSTTERSSKSSAGCEFCNFTTETEPHLTEPGSHLTLTVGLPSALILILVLVCVGRKLRKRCKQKCEILDLANRKNTDQLSDGSIVSYHRYNYIDDNDVGSDNSVLNANRNGPSRCSLNGQYESIGSQGIQGRFESDSSISTISGTMFGNLFEVRNECNEDIYPIMNEGELNQDAIAIEEPSDEIEDNMSRYLTPVVVMSCTYADVL